MIGRTAESSWLQVRTSGDQATGWVRATAVATNANVGALPVVNVPVLDNTAVITAGAVNLRAGDSTQFRSLAVLPTGTQVALLGRNSGSTWVNVRVTNSGQVGWINATTQSVQNIGFLPVVASPPLTDANVQPPPSVPSGANAIVTAGNLNMRQGPGTNFARVGAVSFGQQVAMLGRTGSGPWVLIRNGSGVEGWVNSLYMQFTYDLNALPVVSTITPPPAQPPVVTTPAPPTTHGTLRANTALNVRQGPTTGHARVALLFSGEQATMLGRSSDSQWIKIRMANGTQGWVFAAYTTPATAVANLPVTQ
jgi:uncharacterized protein YraI